MQEVNSTSKVKKLTGKFIHSVIGNIHFISFSFHYDLLIIILLGWSGVQRNVGGNNLFYFF